MLPDPLARPVEAITTNEADGEEVVGWAEAAGGEVALFVRVSFCCWFLFMRGIVYVCDVSGDGPCIGRARSRRLGAGLEPFAFWRAVVEMLGGL